jgi:hypothetical protein
VRRQRSSSVAPGSQTGILIIYENATKMKSQITFKISEEVENLQIQKLLKISRSTTFSITTFSNSA